MSIRNRLHFHEVVILGDDSPSRLILALLFCNVVMGAASSQHAMCTPGSERYVCCFVLFSLSLLLCRFVSGPCPHAALTIKCMMGWVMASTEHCHPSTGSGRRSEGGPRVSSRWPCMPSPSACLPKRALSPWSAPSRWPPTSQRVARPSASGFPSTWSQKAPWPRSSPAPEGRRASLAPCGGWPLAVRGSPGGAFRARRARISSI